MYSNVLGLCSKLVFLDNALASYFWTFLPSELTDHFGVRTECCSEVAVRTKFENVDSVFLLGISLLMTRDPKRQCGPTP